MLFSLRNALRPLLTRLAVLLPAVLIGACAPAAPVGTPTPPPDPLVLIAQSAEQIRAAETFRMTVEVTGPPYEILTDYGAVVFRRADAQYVAPGVMQAALRVAAAGLTIDIDVFARAADQWFRAIWTANTWLNAPFAPGFNPEALIAQDTGFQAAVDSVTALVYRGETTLESGQSVTHLSGTADGPSMNALLIGLIEMQGTVAVDVYLDATTRMPARFVLVESVPVAAETADAAAAEPVARTWTMDIYDIDAPAELDPPDEDAAAATPEAGAAATPGPAYLGVGG